MEIYIVIITGIFLIITWNLLKSRGNNQPPGPWSPPIIGHLLHMKKEGVIRLFERLRKQYGDVFMIYLGSRPLVVFNSYRILKDALVNKQEVCGRPAGLYALETIAKGKGLLWFEGNHQRFLRKWTMNAIDSKENGKISTEEIAQKEAGNFCDELLKQQGAAYDCKDLSLRSVVSCMDTLAFGERDEQEQMKFEFILNNVKLFEDDELSAIPENYWPWLRHLRTNKKLAERMRQEDLVQENIKERIKEKKRTHDPRRIRGIVDLYLSQKEDQDSEDSVQDDDIGRMIMDMHSAGSYTVSGALRWGFVYLMRNRDVQLKCREEITKEMGKSRIPTPEDADKMPYTHATIKEVLRCAIVAHTTLFYKAKDDFSVGGYNIPKDALLLGNLYGVLGSEEHWEEGEEFRPDRWLHLGQTIRKEEFIPFCLGRRSCIGYRFAWTQLFCMLTAVIQKFDLKMPEEEPTPSISEYIVKITRDPRDFKIVAIPNI